MRQPDRGAGDRCAGRDLRWGSNLFYRVDHGKIRPSKNLQNTNGSMLKGNREFIMIDEQKVAYEEILRFSLQCQKDYEINVKLCAFAASEMQEATKEYEAFYRDSI